VRKRDAPHIVLWDLETLPNMIETMKIFPRLGDYPGLTLKATVNSIICFGYKVYGEGKNAKCINAWDYPEWNENINDDKKLCEAAYEILKDAHAVVTHNGKRFDWKFLQTRLLKHNLPPLPKINHIDTCAVAKKNILSFNNSLNILAKAFTDTEKLENGGWDLWVKVSEREPKAMALMSKYCKQDVIVLESLFNKLKAFATEIPNHNLFRLEQEACPNCGSLSLKKSGMKVLKSGLRQRFQCNECGSTCYAGAKKRFPSIG
jgi:DNA polymerase elongation subunit (family B)